MNHSTNNARPEPNPTALTTALNMGKIALATNSKLRNELTFLGDLNGLAELLETLLLGLIQRTTALPLENGQPAYSLESTQQLITHTQAVINASRLPALMEGLEDIAQLISLASDYVGLGWDISISLNQAISDIVRVDLAGNTHTPAALPVTAQPANQPTKMQRKRLYDE